ncbi:hypothetical protein GCM10027026_03320 [Myroides odoratimimus subsp. xuanwuensis]
MLYGEIEDDDVDEHVDDVDSAGMSLVPRTDVRAGAHLDLLRGRRPRYPSVPGRAVTPWATTLITTVMAKNVRMPFVSTRGAFHGSGAGASPAPEYVVLPR